MVATIPSRFTSTLLFNSEYSKQKLFQYSFCSCHKFSSKFKEKKTVGYITFIDQVKGNADTIQRTRHSTPAHSHFYMKHDEHTHIHTSKHVPQHVHRLLRWGEVNRKIIDGAVTGKRKYYLQTVWFIKMHRFGLPSNVLVTNSNYKPGSTGEKCETTAGFPFKLVMSCLISKKLFRPFHMLIQKTSQNVTQDCVRAWKRLLTRVLSSHSYEQ